MKIKALLAFCLFSGSAAFSQEEPKLAAFSITPVPTTQNEPKIEPVLAPIAVSKDPVFMERRSREKAPEPVLVPFQVDPRKKD